LLQLGTRPQLGLIDRLLLTELLLTKLTKHARSGQLLLKALHTKPSTELPGLLRCLLRGLILTKRLLLSLQLRGLIKLLRL
jgi:hypothetical protein